MTEARAIDIKDSLPDLYNKLKNYPDFKLVFKYGDCKDCDLRTIELKLSNEIAKLLI